MSNLKSKKVKIRTIKSNERINNFFPFLLGYNKNEAIKEASRCLNCKNPRCVEACPIKNKIPSFLKSIKDENFLQGYKIILENSILGDICGTICPHEKLCEGHCIKNLKNEGIHIGACEKFLVDWAHQNNIDKNIKIKSNGKSVACIGSGPSSISFALYLIKLGYKVTIYEKRPYLGGILKWGIPSFRLNPKILKRYIDQLKELGCKFILNYEISKKHPLKELIKKYDAIFIGTGCSNPNSINIEGSNLKDIYQAEDFLTKVNLSKFDKNGKKQFKNIGKKVLVVGGGNAAMDASRNAIRLPQVKEVTIVYRRTETEMPACKDELRFAKEEGIKFRTLTNPVKFIASKGKLKKVECAIMELGTPDSTGRKRPIESRKPHVYINADSAILALGFSNNNNTKNGFEDVKIDDKGCIIVNKNNETNLNNVYAGGDAVTGSSTVVEAMKAGLNAAKNFIKKI